MHCYLLPGPDGWTLVDTGLGLPDAAARWEAALDGIEVARIVITHFHPDHVGGGEDVAGADRRDRPPGRRRLRAVPARLGHATTGRSASPTTCSGTACPTTAAAELRPESRTFGPFIRFARDPELLREGDEVDGWRVLELPGPRRRAHLPRARRRARRRRPPARRDHADGRALPGLAARPARRLPGQPAADDRARAALALPGPRRAGLRPGRTRARDPRAPRAPARRRRPRRSARSRAAATRSRSRSSARRLDASGRRFALAETLAHLERLVREGRAARGGDDSRRLLYCGVDPVGRRSHS